MCAIGEGIDDIAGSIDAIDEGIDDIAESIDAIDEGIDDIAKSIDAIDEAIDDLPSPACPLRPTSRYTPGSRRDLGRASAPLREAR